MIIINDHKEWSLKMNNINVHLKCSFFIIIYNDHL